MVTSALGMAMVVVASNSSTRLAMSPIQAFETINEEVVKGWWDPEVVAAFQGLVLNNGSRHGHV